ncbi:MAG TPA: hypothetical protein ENH82_00250 [bacterium]|nr:hypothetical protein [bacterium]
MIPVYSSEGEIIAEVEYNNNFDFWDGRHRGLTQLENGLFILIHVTQRKVEHDSAEIISKRQAVQEILRSGNTWLFELYPELPRCRVKKGRPLPVSRGRWLK